MYVISGKPEENYEKTEKWIEKTIKEQAPDVLVLPELWTTSYAYDILPEIADKGHQTTAAFLSEQARKYSVNIVGGSVADNLEGRIYNTAVAFNRDGEEIYTYHKVHLASTMDEQYHFAEGDKAPGTFGIDGYKAGMEICYDLRFPELSRPYGIEGAQILFFVCAWPKKRIEHWRALLKARAIENQLFVVGCSRVGDCDGTMLGGASMIYNPSGEILCELDEDSEGTAVASLNMQEAQIMRETVGVFKDRRPDVYRFI